MPPKTHDIVFINVINTGDYQFEQEVPIGVASIVSFLRENSINVSIYQCFPDKDENEIINASQQSAILYAFQINMVNFKDVQKVISLIKQKQKKSYIVCGGPFLTTQYLDIISNEPNIDFIVTGEGENTVLELFLSIKSDKKDFYSIDGLIWRDENEKIISNKPRKLIDNLDELPFPARDFLKEARKDGTDNGIIESVRIVTSRGCIGSCNFCCVNLISRMSKGKKWRGRSSKSIADELAYLQKNYGVKVVNFGDSSFDDPGKLGKNGSREICEDIINRGLKLSAKIYLRCETMKTDDDINLLKLYKKAGIDVIIPGIESGSDDELTFYNKKADVADNYRILDILQKLDCFYILPGFIMFGSNSTLESLSDNINLLHKKGFADNVMQVSNVLMLIKDSALYQMLKDEGRLIPQNSPWDIPKYLFADDKAKKVASVWQNIFANYPITQEINKLQVNTGNLLSRLLNPMKEKVFHSMYREYTALKSDYENTSRILGDRMKECFIDILEMADKGKYTKFLKERLSNFINRDYVITKPHYEKSYYGFLKKVQDRGFSFSRLIFKHFTSTSVVSKKDQFAQKGIAVE